MCGPRKGSTMAGRIAGDVKEEQFDLESSCSVVDGPIGENPHESSSRTGILEIGDKTDECAALKHRFHLSVGSLSPDCNIVAAYRNSDHCVMGRARRAAFRMFSKAMSEKRGGDLKEAQAWYATTKEVAFRIVKDGFGVCGAPNGGGSFGFGLHLYSDRASADSVLSAPVDNDGLRHIVFCRVILGCSEEISPGSQQSGPSSEEYDFGVDSEQSPSRYIIWYPDVRTHVLPLYTLSIKLDFSSKGLHRVPVKKPSSPWMPFSALITVLSKSIPPSTMCSISKFHTDFMRGKITRHQLVLQIRQITGDELLISAIKNFQNKQVKRTTGSSRGSASRN